jgi:hypothetical protein
MEVLFSVRKNLFLFLWVFENEKLGTLIGEIKKRFENAVFLTRKRGFFANKVNLGQKNAQNERLCNSLIINDKTFYGQKWVCN